MRRVLLLGFPVLLTAVAALVWVALDATRGRAALSADRPELRALAAPGTVLLLSVDVRGLVRLEEGFLGMASGAPLAEPAEEGSTMARLRRAGVDPRRSVDRIVAAARLAEPPEGEEPELRLAAVATGRFEADRLERALRGDPVLSVRRVRIGDGEALEVERVDRDDCRSGAGRRWHVAIGPGRIVFAEAGDLPWLRRRLAAPAPEGPALAAIPAPLGSPLVAGALFVGEAIRVARSHPMGAAGLQKAPEALEEGEVAAFAAGASALPPRAVLAVGIESPSLRAAETRARRWREALRASRADWEGRVETLAALHDALSVSTSGPVVHLRSDIDPQTLRSLGRLPGELLSLAFDAPDGRSGSTRGEAADEPRYDEGPTPYRPETSPAELGGYDPSVPFAERADAEAGPFGVWIDAARSVDGEAVEDAPGAPGERLLALDIEALASGVPNLGPAMGPGGVGASRAALRVASVRSQGGTELLREESCGKARNGSAAEFETQVVGGGENLLRATKPVRLVPGTRLDDVAAVEGEIVLQLPVRVERHRIPARIGEALEAAGLRLEVTRADERSFSYRLSGETHRLLELRGLAPDGRALANAGYSSMGVFFGSGKTGTARFHGPVDAIEVILASEEERVVRRFAIPGGRPSPTLDVRGGGTAQPELSRSAEELLRRSAPPLPDEDTSPRAEARAGPFRLRVTNVWSFRRIRPQIEIDAPDARLLRGSASAVELRLHRAVQAGGTSQALEIRRFPAFRERYDYEDGLRADLAPTFELGDGAEGGLTSLEGALVLRVPLRSRILALDAEPGARVEGAGLAARLVRLDREGLRLAVSRGAERLVALRAFDRDGATLPVPETEIDIGDGEAGASRVTVDAAVSGAPARLELEVAEALREYPLPFRLHLSDAGDDLAAAP